MTQLIQPLPIEPLIKFLGTVTGRDKAYRTVQYFARFFSWYLSRNGYAKETVAKWNALKGTLGTSRKRKYLDEERNGELPRFTIRVCL